MNTKNQLAPVGPIEPKASVVRQSKLNCRNVRPRAWACLAPLSKKQSGLEPFNQAHFFLKSICINFRRATLC